MVGIDKIREYLGEYNANYVIIGGTATNLNLEDADLEGRATKDIDMIVVCEAVNADYISRFWKFIQDGGYEIAVVDTAEGKQKKKYYRFTNPANGAFPAYIELFSRVPDGIQLPQNAHLVHLNIEEDYLSSFSAILMDDAYYHYAISRSREIEGVQVLDKDALIVLKAKAYLNNSLRKQAGQSVQQDDIDKHKKDIYRLSYLFSGEERYNVADEIKDDLRTFIAAIEAAPISTKAIAKAMGLNEIPMDSLVNLLQTIFQL